MVTPPSNLQQKQNTILDALLLELEHIWHLLVIGNLKDSLPGYQAAFAATVRQFGMSSGAVAAQHYRQMRRAAGIHSQFVPRVGKPPALDQVKTETDWATKNLWSANPDEESAQTLLQGVAEKMVNNVGRDTIHNSVLADKQALGWARVPEPGACAFCVMLATRGAVYKSDRTAMKTAEDEPYHDHCRCQPEPMFTAYEPSAQVREWQALWNRTGSLKDFRKALGNN